MAPTPDQWDGKAAQGTLKRWDAFGLKWDGNVPVNQGAKMQYLHVISGFSSLRDHSLEEVTGSVATGMDQNPAFPTPPVTPAQLKAALAGFTASVAAQNMGGKAATIEKNAKRDALVGMLRQNAAYVQQTCHNDLQTLTSSGFEAAVNTHTRTALDKPVIASVDLGNAGQLLVQLHPLPHAKSYEVRYAVLGTDKTQGPWQSAGMFTDSRAMDINGLTGGVTYIVQVRAIGGTTHYSDWSDGFSHMSM
jgi:hypothetical protein